MKIAVLMSTYNGEKFLDKQLESIYKQTLIDNLELYIRDDGSSDKTFEIIKNWEDKIKIKLIQGKNLGPALSFWDLIKNQDIQADYYAFCDQDDIWDNDKLEVSVNHLQDACLYACNCRIINSEDKVTNSVAVENCPDFTLPNLFVSGLAQGCAMAFTDELRNYVNSLNIECISMHDQILSMYAVVFGKVYWDKTPRFSYRHHSNNVVAVQKGFNINKIKKKINSWKRDSLKSKEVIAQELLNNCLGKISDTDLVYLKWMAHYKSSLVNKYKLCTTSSINQSEYKSKRSYKIRIILNLF